MPSCRDDASEQAKADLEGLLSAALAFARQMLHDRGELLPYGVAVSAAGHIRLVAADVGQRVLPRSVELLSRLVERLRRDPDAIRAYALGFQVRVAGSDAVRVELEHREGHAVAVLLPYRRRRLRRAISYGELTVTRGEHRLWPP